jgi:iron complex outermembrane receptor protein
VNFRHWLLGSVVLTAPLLVTAPAFAAEAAAAAKADEAGSVEEVVVTGKFIATGAQSATKLDIPVADTPLSVAAYTRSFMNAVEGTQKADLNKYMTGVQRAGNTGYDITLRGFKTTANDRNAILTDGLPGLTVRFGSPPTIGIDHVEIVKGPASVLYGQAQPGGFVNNVTKKPRDDRETEVGVRLDKGLSDFGRAGGGLVDLDTTGPLIDGVLDYRVIAEAGYGKGFRDFSYERPIYLAPSVTWRPDDATRATLLLEYRHTRTHYDSYLVAPHNNIANVAPINTTYQEPSDFQWETGETATLLINRDLTKDVTLNVGYRYVDHEDVAQGWDVVAITPDFSSVTRRARGQDNKRTYSFLDANLVANFDLGPISNKMVFGVNVGRETSDFNRTQFFNAPRTGAQSATISILNPVHGLVGPLSSYPAVNPNTPSNLNDRFTTSDASGAYISDFITFSEKLKALVGLRYAKETQDIVEKKLSGVPEQKASSDDWLPMVGVTFEPTEHLSLYATYSTSYVPVAASAQDVNGRYSFSPTTAKSVEGGVKANLMDHRLSITAAIFDIKKENVINTFSCPLGTCSQQLGAEESKGAELEVNFQPLPNWQFAGGLSDVDAKVTKSNIANQVGAQLTNASKINAHFWSRYDIEDGPLNGLGLGLGVAYNSKFYGLLPTATSTDTLPLPGYTTVDLAAYYKIKDVRLTLKVTNLFDRTYYESAGSSGALAILPGQPRTLTLTARTSF